MRLTEILRADCVKVPLEASTKWEAIRELADLIAARIGGVDGAELNEAVLEREKKQPTDLLPGIALPHGDHADIKQKCLAVGKFAELTDWQGYTGQNVGLVCLFMAPSSEPNARTQILQALASTLSDPNVRSAVERATNEVELYNTLLSIGVDLDVPPGFELERNLDPHEDVVLDIAWSPDGRRIATASGDRDRIIRVVDADTGQLVRLLRGHTSDVCSVDWSPDGTRLLSGSLDHMVHVWDIAGGQNAPITRIDCLTPVHTARWSPCGSVIATGGHNFSIRLWDETPKAHPTLNGYIEPIYDLAWSPDGRWIASVGDRLNAGLQLWDTGAGAMSHRLDVGTCWSVAWSRASDAVVVGMDDGGVGVVPIVNGKLGALSLMRGHKGKVVSAEFDRDGGHIASKSDDGTVRLWDRHDGLQVALLPEPMSRSRLFASVAFSPTQDRLCSLSDDGRSVRVWALDRRVLNDHAEAEDDIDGEGGVGEADLASARALRLQQKIEAEEFDVFLCHNSRDKDEVKRIGEELKHHGILPWLDEWNLRPGFPWQRALQDQIGQIKSAAVFVGKDSVGPWQNWEIEAFLMQFAQRRCPVIPVVLPSCGADPELPTFLRTIHMVDFRKTDPGPLMQLIWGITGERPGEQVSRGGRG